MCVWGSCWIVAASTSQQVANDSTSGNHEFTEKTTKKSNRNFESVIIITAAEGFPFAVKVEGEKHWTDSSLQKRMNEKKKKKKMFDSKLRKNIFLPGNHVVTIICFRFERNLASSSSPPRLCVYIWRLWFVNSAIFLNIVFPFSHCSPVLCVRCVDVDDERRVCVSVCNEMAQFHRRCACKCER